MNDANFLEQQWRAFLVVGALLVTLFSTISIALFAYSISQGFPANPLDSPFGDIFIGLPLFLSSGSLFLDRGIIAHRKMHKRLRAIQGDSDTLPIANALPAFITPSSADTAPQESAWRETDCKEVYLVWSRAHYKQRGELLRGCGSVFAGLAAGIAVMIVAIVLTTQLHLPSPWNTMLLIGAIVAPLLIGLAVIVLVLLKRIPLPTLTPVIPVWELYADIEGITLRHGKRVHTMNWQDVRLFEIEQSQVSNPNAVPPTPARPYFALWNGQSKSIVWPAFGEEPFFPELMAGEGLAASELVRRQGELLRMIHDHTQLELRTMSPMLHRPVRNARTIDTSWELFPKLTIPSIVVYVLMLIVMPLICAFTILSLPLTRYPLANIYGALWLGAVAIGAIILFTAATINNQRARHARPRLLLPTPPAMIGSTNAYTLHEKASWREIAANWLALPALLNGVVILTAFAAPEQLYPSDTQGSSLIMFAIFPLAIIAFVGLGIIIAHLIPSAQTILRATPQGLSIQRRRPMDTTSFTWDKIVLVEARHNGKRITGFRVWNPTGKSISWRASHDANVVASLAEAPALNGNAPITPEELMALVLARTGLSIEMAEENMLEN